MISFTFLLLLSLLLIVGLFIKLHYCPVKILDLEINRVDNHPLGR